MTSMFLRKASGVDSFAGTSMFYEYLELYPVSSIDDVKDMFINCKDLLLVNADFSPDWSGNIFDDIAEVGELIAEFFVFLYNFIKWQIITSINIFKLLWGSLLGFSADRHLLVQD